MKALIAWWDLAESRQTIDSLRAALDEEGVEAWRTVPGLRSKFWISEPAGNRWGAVMVWESAPAAGQQLPPNRAAELIGYPPTERTWFDVEAMIANGHDREPVVQPNRKA